MECARRSLAAAAVDSGRLPSLLLDARSIVMADGYRSRDGVLRSNDSVVGADELTYTVSGRHLMVVAPSKNK